ncbi:MAG: RagB/SusD family nutrient uptake outer membrane protein [Prevotellaceae bacterium]|jgi:hypothetical protein|nr:RagB/SusD family nutrient uptake outer membrane protein [Prevotellaceae bacterium]
MKHHIKTSSIFIVILLLLPGCDSFLDTVPDNRTELDTQEKISQLLTSAYPDANYALIVNAMGDGISFRQGLSPQAGYNQYMFNEEAYFWRDLPSTNSDAPTGFWNACYYAIAGANHALAAIDAANNPEQYKYQRSEALLCRAFAHFLLVNLFAAPYDPGTFNSAPGVPYVDQPETKVLVSYSRTTVEYVYARIEEDLEEALKNLPLESQFKVPAYHFTDKAALTFASRFYLYKGDYQKVIDLTSQIVPVPVKAANGNVSATDPANVWAATYFAAFKQWPSNFSEISAQFRMASNKHNFLLRETYSLLARSWTCQYGTMSNTLPSSTVRNITGGYWPFSSFYSTAFRDAYYLGKFTEYFFYTTSTTGTAMIMFPFIRAEEALLNRIEAEIHLEQFSRAINDLNVYYRQRSGSASGTISSAYNEATMVLTQEKINAHWTASLGENFLKQYNAFGAATWSDDKIALMLTLLETKNAEYVQEGFRWFDILRYKIPVYHVTMNNQVQTLLPDDPRRMWQIPESAVDWGLEANPRN